MKNLLLILSLLVAVSSYANDNKKKSLKTFSITGNVEGAEGSLTGVKVMLDDKAVVVYTDFDGNFEIKDVKEGVHIVSFDMVAYNAKKITINPKDKNDVSVRLFGK
jgi:tryptophanase